MKLAMTAGAPLSALRQVAELLNVSEQTVTRKAGQSFPAPVRVGRQLRFETFLEVRTDRTDDREALHRCGPWLDRLVAEVDSRRTDTNPDRA